MDDDSRRQLNIDKALAAFQKRERILIPQEQAQKKQQQQQNNQVQQQEESDQKQVCRVAKSNQSFIREENNIIEN